MFCDRLVIGAEAAGGLSDEVMVKAVSESYALVERKAQLRKAKKLLGMPGVQERCRDLFELVGFSVVDALQMHVEHIRGQAPGQEGVANYQALKDFEKLTLPQQPTKIDQRVLVGHVNERRVNRDESGTVMEARVLSASVEDDDAPI